MEYEREDIDIKQENEKSSHIGPRLWKKNSGIIGNIQGFYRELTPLKLFTILIIVIVSLGTVTSLLFPPKSDVGDDPDRDVAVNASTKAPKLVNVPPGYAEVGMLFEFNMIISDPDTEESDLILELVEGPDWISLDDHSLTGVPSEPSTPEKVVISISDGDNVVEEEFYVVAVENDVELHDAQ